MAIETQPAPDDEAVVALRAWLAPRERVFVLTGAGISTASGIPDYRDATGEWKRPAPVTYQAFVQHASTRARYWARALVGWSSFAGARPNAAHEALARWERDTGRLSMLLTQNVDALHEKAGSQRVVDLHGRLDAVRCLDCGHRLPRDDVQRRMVDDNPGWARLHARAGPHGDADLADADFDAFRIPPCPVCGGMLKPDVVFFGETVPRERVELAHAALRSSDAMLVVGSSLMVYSGYRFARMAHEAGVPLAILTRGVTRADDLASLKLEADCVGVLPRALA
jgi:NAD-dependent SIR2 family protein deacetylase